MAVCSSHTGETRIIFVRHASVHNPHNVYYGRLPRFSLSTQGVHEARLAGAALQDRPLAAVYTSPLLRARQTAQILAAPHGDLRVSVSRQIHEVRSPYDGRDRAHLAARSWDLYTGAGPGYEQPAHILTRVQKFVRRLRRDHAGQTVVAVTHGDIVSFLILWAKGMPASLHAKARLGEFGIVGGYPAPASLTELVYPDQNPRQPPELHYREFVEADGAPPGEV